MLDKAVTDRILDFVRQKPRTVQEVAALLERNWRTADRYADQLAAETGLIATRTFREGTRGALKVVFWNALDRAKGSAHQERLVQKILAGRLKEDFSPFDIYQFVAPQKREALLEHMEFSGKYGMKFDELLGRTRRQLLIFSGNLSWMEYGPRMLETLTKLAKDKVSIKVLTRVDVTSQKNTEAALALNHRVGWDAVEVRHCEQPLRAVIIDDELLSIKEVLSPEQYRELEKKTFIFYRIRDPEWIGWAQKVFWHLWGQSVDARDRLTALESIRTLASKK
jgi:hypothetical protein